MSNVPPPPHLSSSPSSLPSLPPAPMNDDIFDFLPLLTDDAPTEVAAVLSSAPPPVSALTLPSSATAAPSLPAAPHSAPPPKRPRPPTSDAAAATAAAVAVAAPPPVPVSAPGVAPRGKNIRKAKSHTAQPAPPPVVTPASALDSSSGSVSAPGGPPAGGASSGRAVAAGSSAVAAAGAASSAPAATSHTARCRAKVNAKFAELLRILPPPPPNVPIKHKAQMLAYACSVFEGIAARQSSLEAELMLSHPARLEAWLRTNVANRSNVVDALDPVLRLLMSRTGWKCGDAWLPTSDDPGATLRCTLSVVQAGRPPSDPLHEWARASAPVVLGPTVGVPGRVFATRRPEWLPVIVDPPTFVRAGAARSVGVGSCFALPISSGDRVIAVVAVYDTCKRDYDGDVVDLSLNICGAVNRTFSEMPVVKVGGVGTGVNFGGAR